jgi:hypothetical protein
MTSPPELERTRRNLLFFAGPFLFVLGLALLAIVIAENGLTYGPVLAGAAIGALISLLLLALIVRRWNRRLSQTELESARQARNLDRSLMFGLLGISLVAGVTLARSGDIGAFVIALLGLLIVVVAPVAWFAALRRRGLFQPDPSEEHPVA